MFLTLQTWPFNILYHSQASANCTRGPQENFTLTVTYPTGRPGDACCPRTLELARALSATTRERHSHKMELAGALSATTRERPTLATDTSRSYPLGEIKPPLAIIAQYITLGCLDHHRPDQKAQNSDHTAHHGFLSSHRGYHLSTHNRGKN